MLRSADKVEVFRHDFMPLYHGITVRRRRAEVKLVTEGRERRIVGLHAIGMGADELLQGSPLRSASARPSATSTTRSRSTRRARKSS